MKSFLLVLTCVFGLQISASAQLPDGSIAPDFTLTDLDGTTHNLYSYLDEGKVVIIKFFACHCPPCWAYHNTGKLETIYEEYGPDGTDEIMILMLEHDIANPEAFTGGGGYTQGDWTEGNSIPMIDVEGADRAVFEDYSIYSYPRLLKICPDKRVESQSTAATVDHLLDEADECVEGSLNIEDNTNDEVIFYDGINKQLNYKGFENVTTISVFNLVGQNVVNLIGNNNGQVNISSLSGGTYLIRLEHANGIVTKKIFFE